MVGQRRGLGLPIRIQWIDEAIAEYFALQFADSKKTQDSFAEHLADQLPQAPDHQSGGRRSAPRGTLVL